MHFRHDAVQILAVNQDNPRLSTRRSKQAKCQHCLVEWECTVIYHLAAVNKCTLTERRRRCLHIFMQSLTITLEAHTHIFFATHQLLTSRPNNLLRQLAGIGFF